MPREKTGLGAYIPKGVPVEIDDDDDGLNYLDLTVQIPDDDTFHVGGPSDKQAVTTTACRVCGSLEFNVGQGRYSTVLRCVTCKWEQLVNVNGCGVFMRDKLGAWIKITDQG